MAVQKVLCVCAGNSDRSPLLAGVLQEFLNRRGISDVQVESAGVEKYAVKEGRGASLFAINAAKQLGIDLSGHKGRLVGGDSMPVEELDEYDLYLCATSEIAEKLLDCGYPNAKSDKIVVCDIPDTWKKLENGVKEKVVERILGVVYRFIAKHFPAAA